MIKLRIHRNIIAIIAVAAAGNLCAQELRENLEVEGTYIRDIRHGERINVLPSLKDFPLGSSTLNYEEKGVNAEFSPSAPAISATVWGAEKMRYPSLGYLDMNLGSFLNGNLSFGISPLRHHNEQLSLRLQHNSTSLWHPYGSDAPARFNYQEQLGLDYFRNFKGKGILSVSGQYHLGYFNYYGLHPDRELPNLPNVDNFNVGNDFRFPTQTLNDAALKIGWKSRQSIHSSWHADLGARYFGYRTATRETMIAASGGYDHKWSASTRLGFDAEGKMLIYDTNPEFTAPKNYGALRITPFYEWRKNAMRLRIGLDLDMTFNADGKYAGTHYSTFHIAPDVKFDVAGSKVGFFFNVLGGQELQTLASTSQMDPYRNPHLESTMPSYFPIDMDLGLSLTPFSGFAARIKLRYQSLQNVPMGGWYMALLNYGDAVIPGLNVPEGMVPAYGRGLERYNLSGFGAGVAMEYSAGDVFKIGVDGSYSPQHGNSGIFNGLDRPRWIVKAGMSVRPIGQLTLALDYEYRGVRSIYTSYVGNEGETLLPGSMAAAADADEATHPEMKIASMGLKDMNNLSFRASWSVSKNFSITFGVENILNRQEELLPDLKSEGIVFRGGLQWLF